MGFRVVIPARHASTRLPGKPLVDIAGKPMIQHVYERASESGADTVIVATDDGRIEDAVKRFGGEVCMTSPDHTQGTDRIAEVINIYGFDESEIIVNLQGDEPLMPPGLIEQTARDLEAFSQASISTVCTPIRTSAELFDPHVVKVVMDAEAYAMYFSRAVIPWDRDAFSVTTETLPEGNQHFRHIGIYAYRCHYLRQYSRLTPSPIEKMESLEQLRALWHGHRIHVSIVDDPPGHGVDTQTDLERVRQLLS